MRDAIVGDRVKIVGNENCAPNDSGTGIVKAMWAEEFLQDCDDTAVLVVIDGHKAEGSERGYVYEQDDLEVIE